VLLFGGNGGFVVVCSADVPGKVVDGRLSSRIAHFSFLLCGCCCCCHLQAEKLSSLGGLGKEKSAKTLAESEKLLAETVKHCEEMVAGAMLALEGMRSR
jgi:hypothetical protein